VNWIQHLFHKFDQHIIDKNHWNHIPEAPSFYGVERQYKGTPLPFESTTLNPGDWIVELHLDNKKMMEEGLATPQLFRQIRLEIQTLRIILPQKYPNAKGYYGVSVFGSLLKRMGFEIQPYPTKIQGFLIGLWENGIRWIHGSARKWHSPHVLFLSPLAQEKRQKP
jgi:hypothetical protein